MRVNDYERDPYKLLILGGILLWAIVAVCNFTRFGGTLLSSFPSPFGYVFVVGLIVTAGISLYGIIRQRSVRGVLYERTGQVGVGILFLTYAVWATAQFGARAFGFSVLLFSIGIAAILRVVQIERRRRKAVRRGAS
jgi:hypothetical protein